MGWKTWMVFVVAAVVPTAVYAQASITGVVKDASGAVLPGVTVEAASPALIEKARVAVTDGRGQYRIEILPPGTYTVKFALSGFATVERPAIQLTGTFTATIDADLRVGGLEETITVTGGTPLIDVQSATAQRVIGRELIDSLPAGRSPMALVNLIPGVSITDGAVDVGGATRALQGGFIMRVHGSSVTSSLMMENGLSLAALVGPSNAQVAINMAAFEEVVVNYAGGGAEQNAAGVKMNLIPREGGNTFNGTFFLNGTNEALQGSNLSQRLIDAGLPTPSSNRTLYDVNPGFGGPLRADRLWFYASARYGVSRRWAAGQFYDKNANNPNAWTYAPDPSRPVSNNSVVNGGRVRFTWQVAPKVKVGATWSEEVNENHPFNVSSTNAYEASATQSNPVQRIAMADVTAPLTSRLLFDGAAMWRVEAGIQDLIPGLNPEMINVLEQSTGRQYRARASAFSRTNKLTAYRASLSYIPGAHAVKIGIGDTSGYLDQHDYDNNPVSYRFNGGAPNRITMRAFPQLFRVNVDHVFGAWVQDKWTADRLTLTLGLRYDVFQNSFPAQGVGPVPLAPTRSIRFPKQDNLSLHDVNPKLSAVYDVFGDAKTAVKVSLNRHVEQFNNTTGIAAGRNPIRTLVTSTTRSWTDANRNFVPDCVLLSFDANGECGAVANRLFGSASPGTQFDDEILRGWGNREFNWEFSGGVQREILPGVSADVSYFRRWYGNFLATDNRAVSASDYTPFSITIPTDPRLPGGGGSLLSGLFDISPTKFGQSDNYTTFAKNFGKQISHWNGVALNLTARLTNGVLIQGGLDSGRTTTDNCEVTRQLPEMLFGVEGAPQVLTNDNIDFWTPLQFCHQESPFLTQAKLLASYTIPRVAVQVSGTIQSVPGSQMLANYTAPNTVVAPALGRNLAGNAANFPVTTVEPGRLYGERLNQLDFRVAKVVRLGRARATLNFDLYNALNVNTVLTQNNAFASWQQPTSILTARFTRLGVQFDF